MIIYSQRETTIFFSARHLTKPHSFCAMFWMKVGSDAFTKSFARLKECFDGKSLETFF